MALNVLIVKNAHHTDHSQNWWLKCYTADLFAISSLFLLGHFLIDIKHSWDVELHAVQVTANDRPQLIKAWVTGFCNLEKVDKETHHVF